MTTFWWLVKTDLSLLAETIKDKLINTVIWCAAVGMVSGYVMPTMGIMADFGAFQVSGLIIGAIGTEIYGQIFGLLADIDGPRYINYQLILPTSNWLILTAKATSATISSLIVSGLMLPLCKLILWNQLSLTQINYPRFALILVLANIFFAWFALMLSSMVKSAIQADNIIMRVLFPLWYFGCYSFSFKIAYSASVVLGICALASPYTFATEAMRSCMLNSAEFLPFWLCSAVLLLMTVGACLAAYYSLKRRLDFI